MIEPSIYAKKTIFEIFHEITPFLHVIQSIECNVLSSKYVFYLGLGTEGNVQVMSFAWFVVQKGLIVHIDTTDEQDLDLYCRYDSIRPVTPQ